MPKDVSLGSTSALLPVVEISRYGSYVVLYDVVYTPAKLSTRSVGVRQLRERRTQGEVADTATRRCETVCWSWRPTPLCYISNGLFLPGDLCQPFSVKNVTK